MKRLLLSSLYSVIILAAVALPAQARIVVGLSSENSMTASTQITSILSQETGDEVQLRSFDDDAALANWLLRFQELDAAIVSQSFGKQQPAGTLHTLADLHKKNVPSPSVVVVRSNLSNNKRATIQKALLALGSTESGRKALATAGIEGFTLPGEALKLEAVKPEPLPKKTTPKISPPSKAIKVESKPKALTRPVEVTVKQKTKEDVPATQTKKTVETEPAKTTEPKLPQAVKKSAPPVPIAATPKTAKESAKPVEKVSVPVKKEVTKKAPVSPKPDLAEQPVETETDTAKPSSNKRLILFVALIILVAILLKLALLIMRWQSKKKRTVRPAPSLFVEPMPELNTEVVEAPEEEAPENEPLVVETGYIGPGKVPALLKRCADLPEPVVLQVTKDSCEKLIYFAGGQVSGAMTQNATSQESGVRWSKLGSMLLREEFITNEERDQALALLTREPELRFGEALLKLGYITLAELRHALTRQAKITIYSLILFPEGKYKVFSEEGSLPPEESVSLEVTNLIREASHHQSEWMAIRQALPNLNTALDFTPEGREKLEQVNLSPQQEEMLSLIDGKRTINELGIDSAMMDYEVYRFLYLMVKAGVLQ